MADSSGHLENGDSGTRKLSSGGMLLEQVHKFGGTCVSAAERIASAAQLVLKNAENGDRQVTAAPNPRPSCVGAGSCRWAHSCTPDACTGTLWHLSRRSFQAGAPDSRKGP